MLRGGSQVPQRGGCCHEGAKACGFGHLQHWLGIVSMLLSDAAIADYTRGWWD